MESHLGFKGSTSAASGGRREGKLETLLLRTVDGGLAGAIFVVPLLLGGRQALGQLVLVALAVAAALAWAVRRCLKDRFTWRPTGATGLLVAGAALVILQVTPLPRAVLDRIAPRTAEILPLWNSAGDSPAHLGPWRTISFTPAATRAGLVLFLAYALLYVTAVQRIRAIDDVERLLRWCAAAALMMAGFGLVQLLTGNGKFFWIYEHPFSNTLGTAKGSFTNHNHFAQFLALGIGPLLWWIQSAFAPRASGRHGPGLDLKANFLVLGLGIVLFAGLLSLSRAGMIAILLAAAIATTVCYRAALLERKLVAAIGAAGLLMGVALLIFGSERVSRRVQEITSGSVEQLDRGQGRRGIWGAVAHAIPNYWLLGSGVGSHPEIYPVHLRVPLDPRITYTHAESSYLQVALETGVAGLALALGGVALCARWCLAGLRRARSQRLLVCVGAIAASLAACALHAAVDFVWYVPGCMTVVVLLAACAWRSRQLAEEGAGGRSAPRILPRFAAVAATVALAAVGAGMIAGRFGPVLAEPDWMRYQLSRLAGEAHPLAANPGGPAADEKAKQTAVETERKHIAWLEEVTRWQPEHARAHVELAERYLRLFDLLQISAENPMPLAHLREAVIAAGFSSRSELTAWLRRAVGEHWLHLERALWHAREGLSLCPLQGEAYVFLAEMAFLEGMGEAAKTAYLDQALRVRPFDGEVLYAAGKEALVAGDVEQGIDYLKRCFQCGPIYRQRVMQELVAHALPEALEGTLRFLVAAFEPGLEDLRFLQGVASHYGRPEELVLFRRYYAEQAEAQARASRGPEAARLWTEAHGVHALLGDDDRALDCARQAQTCDPDNYDVRYALAARLLRQGLFAEAEPHLSWCLKRRPDNRALERMYKEVLQGRLAGQRDAVARKDGETPPIRSRGQGGRR